MEKVMRALKDWQDEKDKTNLFKGKQILKINNILILIIKKTLY